MNPKYHFVPDPNTGFLTDDDTKKYISRFFWSVFAMEVATFVSATIISTVVALIIRTFAPGALASADFVSVTNNLISDLSIYCIALPIFCIVANPLPIVKPTKVKMGVGKWITGFCICVFFMQTGSYISNMLITFVQGISGSNLTNPVESMIDGTSIWIDILFLVVVAPVLEELLFRKILCDKLLPLGEGYAVIISAVVFGLSHGNLFQFAYAALIGLVFAFVYVKTGKLIYSITYHMALNFLGGIVAPWVYENADIDGLLNFIESGSDNIDEMMNLATGMLPLLVYNFVFYILATVGLILFIIVLSKKRIAFESGILAPPPKKRFVNVVFTTGTAALVTAYVVTFILSILT